MQSDQKNIKYPYLPEGRTILYVPEDNIYIQEAKKFSFEHATDRRYPSGALIVLGGEVVGRGALCARLKSKKLIKLHQDGWCIRKMLKIKERN